MLARATVLAVTAGAVVSVVPAQAAPRAAEPGERGELAQAVRPLTPHVTRRADGTFRLDVARPGVRLADGGVLARGGVNELSFHWWGIRVDLDSYWTKKLLAAINTGAGAAGIAAALAAAGVISSPGALPTGVAAGILAIGSGVIGFCSNDNGVSLYVTYNGMPWCSGQ